MCIVVAFGGISSGKFYPSTDNFMVWFFLYMIDEEISICVMLSFLIHGNAPTVVVMIVKQLSRPTGYL